MARKKPEPNIWQQCPRAPYDRIARLELFGEYDVLASHVAPGQDADGNLVFGSYESEPVTNPILVRWVDTLMAFDVRAHQDAAPLIALLDSDFEILPIVGIWLANLVWRHGILTDGIEDFVAQRRRLAELLREFVLPPLKAGRPKVPAYDMSKRDEELYIANNQVTHYRKMNGGTVAGAIAAIASRKFPHDPEAQARFTNTLRLFRKEAHTSARKAAQRRRGIHQ